LEYTNVMNIGQPKLSETKSQRNGLFATPTYGEMVRE
jgi:hypothetical protein